MPFHSYEQWRETIPWSNREILSALRESALTLHSEWLRAGATRTADYFEKTGRLSSKLLGYALPHLVKKCSICGKKALYRTGTKGRCSEHRMVPDKDIKAYRDALERAHNVANRDANRADKAEMNARKLHGTTIQRKEMSSYTKRA